MRHPEVRNRQRLMRTESFDQRAEVYISLRDVLDWIHHLSPTPAPPEQTTVAACRPLEADNLNLKLSCHSCLTKHCVIQSALFKTGKCRPNTELCVLIMAWR